MPVIAETNSLPSLHSTSNITAGNSPAANLQQPTLALELFKESEWQSCRTECSRCLLISPSPILHLMHAVCGLRIGMNTKDELLEICGTSDDTPAYPPNIAAMAHYELGRAYWNEDNNQQAFIHLKKAFFANSSVEVYRLSGCSLYLLLKENPDIDSDDPGLRSILATTRKEWNRELFAECRKPTKDKPSAAAAPARMLIRFYQTQIGPAIGSRCSLHPSCSHYAMQALKTHGLIGIGIMSDRFIREPDVVAAKKNPVIINGRIKYSDPLSDHDQWMKK